MPRVTKPLTDTQVKQAKPRATEYSLSDGNGLALRVKPSGTKSWLFNYYTPFTKKRTNISLGIYPDVSLVKARSERQAYRSLLANGVDPADYRKEQESENAKAHTTTFEVVYRQWLTTKQDKSESYLHRLTKALELHILPALGDVPVHKINAPATIKIIQPLADRQALETIRKLCRWINEVMTFAVNTGQVHSNSLAGISKAFQAPKVENRPTIKPEELPLFLKTLESAKITTTTRCLIEWLLHTMVRPGEAAEAKWDEINLTTNQWVIPAERMKQRRDHIVPLTNQMLTIIETMKPISAHREYVFPSNHKPREPINKSSANMALKRMGYKGQLVAHGLRSLASTVLNEQEFSHDVIEAALAHVDKNSIRATYNRAEYLEQRRVMMQWWSDHISQTIEGSTAFSGSKHLRVVRGR
jgi:integrase